MLDKSAYNKAYSIANKERLQEYQIAYRQANRAKRIAASIIWAKSNPVARKAIQQRSYIKNKEKRNMESVCYAKNNPDRTREINRRYRERWRNDPVKKAQKNKTQAVWKMENISRHLLGLARRRAKKNGISFNIDLSDIVIPCVCPLLGIPIEVGSADRNRRPSVDRIDNERGYVKGNVLIVSLRANVIKRDATAKELMMIATSLALIMGVSQRKAA